MIAWKERHGINWDATSGRNGGTEGTAREALPKDSIKYNAGESSQDAITAVLHFSKSSERVGLLVV